MFKKFKFKFIFNVCQAFKNLEKSGYKTKIELLKSQILKTNVSFESNFIDYFFKKNNFDKNLYIKQYLYNSLIYENKYFSKIFLFSINKKISFIYPLPDIWIDAFNDNGIPINKILCKIIWKLFCIYKIFKSLVFFLLIILKSLPNLIKSKSFKKYIFFDSVTLKMFPQTKIKKYDFFSWFTLNFNSRLYEKNYYTNNKLINYSNEEVKIKYKDIFLIDNFKSFFLFVIVSIFTLPLIFFSIFSKHSFHSLLSIELIKALAIKFQKKEFLAERYIFNMSNFIHRPLWTYEVETKNSIIDIIFFATSINQISDLNYCNPYSIISWSYYHLWDDVQKSFIENSIKRKIKSKNYSIINYNDTKNSLDQKFDLVIFDDKPFRLFHYSNFFMRGVDHWNEKSCCNFLEDILQTLGKKNISVCLKKKKPYLKDNSKKYLNIIKKYKGSLSVLTEDFSAIEVIENSKLIISFPYGTTANIAKNMGKQSIYYYPGEISANELLTRKIPILKNKKDLEIWVDKHL